MYKKYYYYLALIIKPALEISSNWYKHAINLLLEGAFAFYADNDTENYDEYVQEMKVCFSNSKFDIEDFEMDGDYEGHIILSCEVE